MNKRRWIYVIIGLFVSVGMQIAPIIVEHGDGDWDFSRTPEFVGTLIWVVCSAGAALIVPSPLPAWQPKEED